MRSEPGSGLSERELADLCALADGTLPPERRLEVEARVAASAELRELFERQRRAVAATRMLEADPAPASLSAALEGRRQRAVARRDRRWRLALTGAAAAVAAVVVAVLLQGGPGGPTVAEAAALGVRSPSAPAPPQVDEIGVDGVTFPDLAQSYGWRPVGVRRDRVDGRAATVVFYEKSGRRIAYVIVSGSGLPRPSGAASTTRGGIEFQTLRVDGRLAVTWRRGGHTCVLVGATPREELLTLATWSGGDTDR
jgi:anti-sigma factor RsiW